MTLICLFFFNTPPTTVIYTLSLHDALPISANSHRLIDIRGPHCRVWDPPVLVRPDADEEDSDTISVSTAPQDRSEEHTSELQSRFDLVCRLLLEKKK